MSAPMVLFRKSCLSQTPRPVRAWVISMPAESAALDAAIVTGLRVAMAPKNAKGISIRKLSCEVSLCSENVPLTHR